MQRSSAAAGQRFGQRSACVPTRRIVTVDGIWSGPSSWPVGDAQAHNLPDFCLLPCVLICSEV